ncbi:radical SAM protein [bacterium]|nr:radical SAM protein [bacterium]
MTKTNNKVWLENVGPICNNNCIFCSIKKDDLVERSGAEILTGLKKGYNQGFRSVEFTGGQPTLRKDLVDLTEFSKNLGYKNIGISTNGRMLSYSSFSEKLINAGLNWFTFSLHGPNTSIHDAITRTPGSFLEAVKGVKKIVGYKKVYISITSVLCSINYKYLSDLGLFISSLGIDNWNISDLIPEGSASENYKSLFVDLEKIKKELEKIKNIQEDFREINIFDFPFCYFPSWMLESDRFNAINTQFRGENIRQNGYNPERILFDKNKKYTDINKKKTEECNNCVFDNKCGGFWIEYLKNGKTK